MDCHKEIDACITTITINLESNNINLSNKENEKLMALVREFECKGKETFQLVNELNTIIN